MTIEPKTTGGSYLPYPPDFWIFTMIDPPPSNKCGKDVARAKLDWLPIYSTVTLQVLWSSN